MAEPEPRPAGAAQPLHAPDVEKGGIGRALRDIILGGQDGLVNVLGLVLGVAAATAQLRIILAAALAATFSESIAMGGVMYTSVLAERDYYLAMLAKEQQEVAEVPEVEIEEVRHIFREKGLRGPAWEARDAMSAAGFARPEDLVSWQEAFERIDQEEGPPALFLPVFTASGRLRG